ncbi:MAG: imidazole glycerol phosphate synthase subunit HisH [Erythrobacter sp.]
MIVILDYGIGNLGSVRNMFRRVGFTAEVSSDPAILASATKIILPGVGAFDRAMNCLSQSGLRDILDERVMQDRVPILGICLGMQLLCSGSEEGKLPGLGYIRASAKKLKPSTQVKVPHMGWNLVRRSSDSELTRMLPDEARFYFVHSYAVHVEDERNSLLKCHYGEEFDAGVVDDNIFGVQFHPEKSHKFGRNLFKAFGEL